jgi:hypothetical protein
VPGKQRFAFWAWKGLMPWFSMISAAAWSKFVKMLKVGDAPEGVVCLAKTVRLKSLLIVSNEGDGTKYLKHNRHLPKSTPNLQGSAFLVILTP